LGKNTVDHIHDSLLREKKGNVQAREQFAFIRLMRGYENISFDIVVSKFDCLFLVMLTVLRNKISVPLPVGNIRGQIYALIFEAGTAYGTLQIVSCQEIK
jgi:hypothetical protein